MEKRELSDGMKASAKWISEGIVVSSRTSFLCFQVGDHQEAEEFSLLSWRLAGALERLALKGPPLA